MNAVGVQIKYKGNVDEMRPRGEEQAMEISRVCMCEIVFVSRAENNNSLCRARACS